MKNAYFAGGCFWCITPVFEKISGVSSVRCGYSGGDETDPKYEDVKHQRTGHRETVKVEYDENSVSFSELLDIFLRNVNVYDGGGQYIDRGHSYTLAVYYGSEEEKQISEQKICRIQKESGREIFVSVEPFKSFFDAEEYHQDYYRKNPEAFEQELIESGRKIIKLS